MFKRIPPRGNRKISKSKLKRKKQTINTRPYTPKHEPVNIDNIFNSPYQHWRRVYEWDRYVNDPLEKQTDTY